MNDDETLQTQGTKLAEPSPIAGDCYLMQDSSPVGLGRSTILVRFYPEGAYPSDSRGPFWIVYESWTVDRYTEIR